MDWRGRGPPPPWGYYGPPPGPPAPFWQDCPGPFRGPFPMGGWYPRGPPPPGFYPRFHSGFRGPMRPARPVLHNQTQARNDQPQPTKTQSNNQQQQASSSRHEESEQVPTIECSVKLDTCEWIFNIRGCQMFMIIFFIFQIILI